MQVKPLITEDGEVSFGAATTHLVALDNFDPAHTDERVVLTYFGRETHGREIAQEFARLRETLKAMRRNGFHVGSEFMQADCVRPFFWSVSWPFDDASDRNAQAILKIYNFNNVDSEHNAPITFSTEVIARALSELGVRFGFNPGKLYVNQQFIEYEASCDRIRYSYGADKDPRNGASLRFFFDSAEFDLVLAALDVVWREIDQTCRLSFVDAPLLEEYNRWHRSWPNLPGAYLLLVDGALKGEVVQQYRSMSTALHGFLPLFKAKRIDNGRTEGIVTVSVEFREEGGYLFLSANTDITSLSQMMQFIKDAGFEDLFSNGAVFAD